MSVVFKTVPNRNVFFGPEKSRFPSAQIASVRSEAVVAVVNRCVFGLHLDRLSRGNLRSAGMGEDHPSHGSLRFEFVPVRLEVIDHFFNEGLSIPVAFHIEIEERKSVR